MELIYELITLIQDNWSIMKEHIILFILFGILWFGLGLLCGRRYNKSFMEQSIMEERLKKLTNENSELHEQIRDLTTTNRMFREDSKKSIGEKIVDALNKEK